MGFIFYFLILLTASWASPCSKDINLLFDDYLAVEKKKTPASKVDGPTLRFADEVQLSAQVSKKHPVTIEEKAVSIKAGDETLTLKFPKTTYIDPYLPDELPNVMAARILKEHGIGDGTPLIPYNQGGVRGVYLHPTESGKLVKVPHSDDPKEIAKVISRERALEKFIDDNFGPLGLTVEPNDYSYVEHGIVIQDHLPTNAKLVDEKLNSLMSSGNKKQLKRLNDTLESIHEKLQTMNRSLYTEIADHLKFGMSKAGEPISLDLGWTGKAGVLPSDAMARSNRPFLGNCRILPGKEMLIRCFDW